MHHFLCVIIFAHRIHDKWRLFIEIGLAQLIGLVVWLISIFSHLVLVDNLETVRPLLLEIVDSCDEIAQLQNKQNLRDRNEQNCDDENDGARPFAVVAQQKLI